MDMNQYLEIFIEETKEHLQLLNQSLLALEKSPNDTAMVNEIFRVAHTLKGMSGTMGYSRMARLTHDMENVLQALRSGNLKVTTTMLDVLFKCLDALEGYLNSIINSSDEGNNEYKEIIDALDAIINGRPVTVNAAATPAAAAATPATVQSPADNSSTGIDDTTEGFFINQYEQNVINNAVKMGYSAFSIRVMLNHGCVLKSARAFIVFQTLEKLAEIIKSIPKVEDIEDEKFDYDFTVGVISKNSADEIKKALMSISEVDEVIIKKLEAKKNEEANSTAATVEKADTGSTAQVEGNDHPDTPEAPHDDDNKAVTVSGGRPKTNKTVRVDIDRLDVLMNLVSELIIIKTRLKDLETINANQDQHQEVENLERITTNLNDAVMKVRMVPIETVFNRFPRTVRDMCRTLGKDINLVMSGEETELDRTVIDEIGDPLIHLLRNSVDHGIEDKEKRAKSGKSTTGKVALRAYQDGNNVVIEVEDDGSGIDVEKVKKKAIDNGIISKEMAANLSKKDVLEFLFRPSFSTADKVTDYSGRGVGLDVVKTKIEALGGTVEVDTNAGKGSKFIIRLPLTLAIMQALLVMVGEEKYAIPLGTIQEIVSIKPEDIKFVQKQEVTLLRKNVLPILRLGQMLDVEREDKPVKTLTVVVVKKGDKFTGLVIDKYLGQQEIVIKTLGKLLTGIRCIAGATILGDGNVALILDINSLV